MTTYTCPDGHTSQAGDYCDVCGAPIPASASSSAAGAGSASGSASGSPASSPAPPPLPVSAGLAPAGGAGGGSSLLSLDTPPASGSPAAPPSSRVCPNCNAANLPAALFCEDCGYDFTTGQLPRPLDPPSGSPSTGNSPAASPATGGIATGSPADVAPDRAADLAPDVLVQAPPQTSTGAGSTGTPASTAPTAVEWVVELWVDPDWYDAQDVSDPCPSAGMPVVVPLRERSVLVGRTSASRNIHPQVDVAGDTGVSRRHAQLTTDGQRWWVEDLQSANGTYVGASGEPLPTTPIPPGQRTELPDDGRVYVGAWTRLVVRKASPSETTL